MQPQYYLRNPHHPAQAPQYAAPQDPISMAVAATAAAAASVGSSLALGVAINWTVVAVSAAIAATATGASTLLMRAQQPSAKQTMQDRKATVRQPISPRQIVYGRIRVGGTIVFLQSTDSNKYLHMVVTLAGHEIDEIGDIYFNDVVVPLDADGYVTEGSQFYNVSKAGMDRPLVRVKKYLGTATQTADADLVAASGGKWTAAHRGQGVAYLYIRMTWDPAAFSGGIPQVTAIVKGKKVHDPRTDTTAWTDNAALCIRDYLLTPVKDGGVGALSAELDAANWVAAANLCDETVPVVGTELTEKRYSLNGNIALAAGNTPKATIESLLTSCAGTLTYAGGRWRLLAAAYRTPTVTLTESDLRGPIQVQTRVSRRDIYNAVKGTFVSPANMWQPADYPALTSDTAMAEDGGERIFREMDRPFTTSTATAQRLAKIALLKTRQPITVNLACKLTAFRVQVGDVVNITNTRFGWAAKPFEVIEWSFALTDDGLLGIDMSLRETDGSIYDWSTSEEQEVDPAPNTDLPSAFATAAPTGVTTTPTAVIAADGTTQPALTVAWAAPTDAFLLDYEVQWRRSTDADFNSVMTRAQRYVIAPVTPGVTYVVRVRAINTLGFLSPFASASDTAAVPDTVAPGVCTGVSATGGVRSINIGWAPPADKDVRHIEIWENTTDNRAGAYNVGVTDARHFSRTGLSPGVTRWYWVRAVDTTGNTGDWNAVDGVSATTSLLLAEDLEDAIINTAKFAAGITPVELVTSLPVTNLFEGRIAYMTSEGRMYKVKSGVWENVVNVGELPNGSITSTLISDGSISTPKLATNAVTADKILAGEINADHLSANSVTAGKVAAGAISTTELAAGAVNAAKLAATELITLNAQLGTAVVGTLNVLDGAINGVKIEDLAASNSAGATTSSGATLSVALTCVGKPVTIIASASGSLSGGTTGATGTITFKADGVALTSAYSIGTMPETLEGDVSGAHVYTYTPAAGARTFTVDVNIVGARISIWAIENRK